MEKNPQDTVMRQYCATKHFPALFAALTLFLYPGTAFSSQSDLLPASELTWVLKNIKANEKTLKSFTAEFVQTKNTALLLEPLRSKGLIYFDVIGKLLVRVTRPSPVTLLFSDNRLLIYYPDLSESEERYLGGDSVLKKYFGIGQSIEELKKQYGFQLISKTPSEAYHLRLIPKTEAIAKHIDAIEVHVNPRHWLPERIDIKENKGDFTSILLDFTSINASLPADIFTIDIRENH